MILRFKGKSLGSGNGIKGMITLFFHLKLASSSSLEKLAFSLSHGLGKMDVLRVG
ncbi:hypothetical protein HanRHA438_Chr16g0745921 [Helianthus annuus]|nr:hypothetical protein HanRHA438_Chr16g0745921 [Helianthus annuus]